MNTLEKYQFDVQHFIDKFEGIPDDEWTVGAYRRFSDENVVGRCAHGHCGCVNSEEDTEEGEALYFIFKKAFGLQSTGVNDADYIRFQQESPRDRMLAALYVLKARGW